MFAEKKSRTTGSPQARTQKQEKAAPVQSKPEAHDPKERFLQDFPLAARLVEQIQVEKMSPDESLNRLKENFMESGFTYTMAATHPDTFLKGTKTEGDCSTLAKAYVKIAQEYLGIKDVKVCSKTTDFLVPGGGRVLDQNNATGNVDNGKHWAFTSHYWVDSPIGSIDLLFLGQAVNESAWIDQTDTGEENGIEYRDFGPDRVYAANYMGATLADKYATDIAAAKRGKAASEAAMAAAMGTTERSKAGSKNFLSRLFK